MMTALGNLLNRSWSLLRFWTYPGRLIAQRIEIGEGIHPAGGMERYDSKQDLFYCTPADLTRVYFLIPRVWNRLCRASCAVLLHQLGRWEVIQRRRDDRKQLTFRLFGAALSGPWAGGIFGCCTIAMKPSLETLAETKGIFCRGVCCLLT